MAPCSESSSGWAIASPPRNPDLSGGRSSPLDFNPDIKSADAALQRISRAANGEGGTKYTREDIVDCFERVSNTTLIYSPLVPTIIKPFHFLIHPRVAL